MNILIKAGLAAALAGWMAVGLAQTADSLSALRARYPSGSIQSLEQADAALEATQKAQQDIDAQYQRSQRACYDRFFVNACLEKEKTHYQKQNATINAIDLEANRFHRQIKAQQAEQKRQMEEAARQRNAPQDALEREKNRLRLQEKQSESQARQAERLKKQETGSPAQPKSVKVKPDDRARRELNAAQQRKKVQEAAERRAEMAKKHAENEAERARKEQERLR